MSDNPEVSGAPPSAPSPDLSRIDERLNRISDAVNNMTRSQEINTIRNRISARGTELDRMVKDAETAVDRAEADLAAAYDEGDGATIAKRQRDLAERVATREHARGEFGQFQRAVKEMESRSGGSTGAPSASGNPASQPTEKPAKDTTNLNGWKKRNSSWYGVDDDMTKAAHEFDRSIRGEGVIADGSQEYFREIDRRMAQKYPDKFRSTPQTGGGTTREQGGHSMTGKIPNDVLDGWRRMGINVDDDKTLERMVANRQKLVDKEILPETPTYGRVLTR